MRSQGERTNQDVAAGKSRELHAIVTTIDEQGFIILKHERKASSLAMCQRCEFKFFTPPELSKNPIEAEEALLRSRFNAHKCKVRDFPVSAKRAVNQ